VINTILPSTRLTAMIFVFYACHSFVGLVHFGKQVGHATQLRSQRMSDIRLQAGAFPGSARVADHTHFKVGLMTSTKCFPVMAIAQIEGSMLYLTQTTAISNEAYNMHN
jgi:hypothetical protein